MIKRIFSKKQLQVPLRALFSQNKKPILFGNGNSIFSVCQLWDGAGEKPYDYCVQDQLRTEISGQWKVQSEIFRVLYEADLSNSSMDINVNTLKKNALLNQLIQLSASEKEQLVLNPSTVIINPRFIQNADPIENQITRNIKELHLLFNDAVGLKTSYLINQNSLTQAEYLTQISHLHKAISSDVGLNFDELIFNHGYKLEHVFLNGTNSAKASAADPAKLGYELKNVFLALGEINFKGKVIVGSGTVFDVMIEAIAKASRQAGYSKKDQFQLQNDGWHTML